MRIPSEWDQTQIRPFRPYLWASLGRRFSIKDYGCGLEFQIFALVSIYYGV